jgi:hypothetical protein
MKLEINHRCADFDSYRAARVKSLFNVDDGSRFDLTAELPIEDMDWKLGLVVGPSGSGKTSIGRRLFGRDRIATLAWPDDTPIIDNIAPNGTFDHATAALSAVGLGSVPSWLRPYSVLSNGERFRADLARLICDAPAEVVIDEFTSVVDRQRCSCRATTILSSGFSRIGFSTRRQESSPEGVIGDGRKSPWKSARPDGSGGGILSSIII